MADLEDQGLVCPDQQAMADTLGWSFWQPFQVGTILAVALLGILNSRGTGTRRRREWGCV